MRESPSWTRALAPLTLIVIIVALITVGLRGSRASQNRQNDFHQQIRHGLGSEVRLAQSGDSPDQIRQSIDSVDSFIRGRAGLAMSPETKNRLANMEERAVKGTSPLISIPDLEDALTDTAVNRIANLSDPEIDDASSSLRANDGSISLRASGQFTMSPDEFGAQVRAARAASAQRSPSFRDTIHSAIQNELERRVSLFGQAVPEQFGQASSRGVTPTQALLLTYSVVADDPLHQSRDTLQRAVDESRKSMPRQNRGSAAHRAYGVNGYFFSAPVHLIFNKTTSNDLLDRLEKGGK